MANVARWLLRGSLPAVGICVLSLANFTLGSATANAAYPDHPVRLISGFAPGGGNDAITRIIGKGLSDRWGQPVLVENKPGADGMIAADVLTHSPPDGYTIMTAASNNTMAASLHKLNFDPVKSFAPITMLGLAPEVLAVNSGLPVNSLKEFIEYAKSKPGQLNFGSLGTGTPNFLAMALLMQKTGMKLVNVTYQGTGPSLVALLGGETQALFGSILNFSEYMKSGKVKVLAVASAKRSPAMPDVPSIAEVIGKDFDVTTWWGIVAPAGTPKDVQTKLHADLIAVLKTDDVQRFMSSQGADIIGDSPEEFSKIYADEVATYAALLKSFQ